jgi:hypothetical protein
MSLGTFQPLAAIRSIISFFSRQSVQIPINFWEINQIIFPDPHHSACLTGNLPHGVPAYSVPGTGLIDSSSLYLNSHIVSL